MSDDPNRRNKWDRRYLGLAKEISSWSKDPSTKVGAVLVNAQNRIVSTGFNGFPARHSDDPAKYADRAYKYAHIIHAERNALSVPHRRQIALSTIYSSFPCCPTCMTLICKAGVRRVVCPPVPTEGKPREWVEQWQGWFRESLEIAERAGVEVSLRHV